MGAATTMMMMLGNPPPAVAASLYRLYSWGNNGYTGRLGLNLSDNSSISSPTQIGALTDWKDISANINNTFAIRSNGTLWSWGSDYSGSLGLGTESNRQSSPTQIGALTSWSKIAGGNNCGFAIKTDGTLWAWGYNRYDGRLGLGDKVDRSSPVQIGSGTNWSIISSCTYNAVAIKTDGTMWAWGKGGFGTIGDGTVVYRSSPVQIGSLTNWAKASVGGKFALAIKTDGTLWAWGYNVSGQLGININGPTFAGSGRSSPVQVGSLTDWSDVKAGTSHTLAVKTDGTLWSWGINNSGALGLGDSATPGYQNTSRSSPVQVGALTTWSKVSANSAYSAAIKTDGTLWAWGRNASGQLGINSRIYRSSPVQVGALSWFKVSVAGNPWAVGITKTQV